MISLVEPKKTTNPHKSRPLGWEPLIRFGSEKEWEGAVKRDRFPDLASRGQEKGNTSGMIRVAQKMTITSRGIPSLMKSVKRYPPGPNTIRLV